MADWILLGAFLSAVAGLFDLTIEGHKIPWAIIAILLVILYLAQGIF